MTYDPLGRLWQMVKGAANTRFLYDGDALIGEYDAAGTLTARYVHGSNLAADDPLVWYVGAGTGTKRYIHADHLGSAVAATNTVGAPTINSYDEYGIPGSANVGRFQYTGQIWLSELGLYHYKARLYSPTLGRFLQMDPVGYKDQINLYAYVANDPINANDPSGLKCPLSSDGRTAVCQVDNPNKALLADQKAGGQKLADMNRKYTNTVNKLLGDRSGRVTLAKVSELGSRIRRDYTTTKGEIADQLIAAEVSVSDKAAVNPMTGKTDRFGKADAVQTATGPKINLYPRAFDRGMVIEKTFVHEGAHLTREGQNFSRDFHGNHQGVFDRMENEVWNQ